MNRLHVVVLGCLVAASAHAASAQEIGRVTVDFATGSGPHTDRVGDTWFRKSHNVIYRAGGAVRLLTGARRFAPVARVDFISGGMADQTSDCPPAPNNTCRRYFPKTGGVSIGAGVVSSLTSRAQVETTAGLLRSTANRYVAVSASYRLVDHVAALADWRYFDLDYTTGRLSFRPWQFGVRFF